MLSKLGPLLTIEYVMLATLLAVASCATGPTAVPVAAHPECAGWTPIRLSAHDVDVLSDAGVEQIVAHNRYGQTRCGWKP